MCYGAGMSRSTRLFEIIQILRSTNAPVTARAMAEALEVTPRTVYRDMAALMAMRVPVEGEAGVGYMLRAGFDLPPLMLTPEETEALIVGAALLQRTGDAGLERAARSAIGKIAAVVPESAAHEVPLRVSGWTAISDQGMQADDLRGLIRDGAELEIGYTDLQDRATRRRVLPLALIYYVDVVVLAAWCEMRQAFRHFRIDRITACKATGQISVERCRRLRFEWERDTGLQP